MNSSRKGFVTSRIGLAGIALSVAATFGAAGLLAKNDPKPTEVPAKVIAHLPLKDAPGSEMLLQNRGDHQYLYVQKSNKQGFMVVEVTKPSLPALVAVSGGSTNDAPAGKLEIVGPDIGLAEVPDKNSKSVIRSADSPTETVKLLDLSDPTHPKVIQTFTGVTSTLQDPGRGLIYLVNNEGLWILRHPRPGITPAKTKKACGSEDALASMPPDCQ